LNVKKQVFCFSDKTYQTFADESHHYETFLLNYLKIVKHNVQFKAGRESYQLRMNSFGDMTYSEFISTMNGYKRSTGGLKRDAKIYAPQPVSSAPKNIDWRKLGLVTPVKDQKACGSCWAFSATGSLEGQHMRKYGSLVSLSEQNLVDCSSKFGNMGCNGGLMEQAFEYIKSNGGIDTEKSYPYEGIDGKCRFNNATIGATDHGYVDIMKDNETALMLAVANVGPVSVAIDASQESFQFYHKGVYYERKCSTETLNHGVLVVGYGSSNRMDYWIVKNSWGTGWGDKGYILMARNKRNNCGIASAASYPLV
ncbi:papain family cysteine protease, partial [Trichuris suis]